MFVELDGETVTVVVPVRLEALLVESAVFVSRPLDEADDDWAWAKAGAARQAAMTAAERILQVVLVVNLGVWEMGEQK